MWYGICLRAHTGGHVMHLLSRVLRRTNWIELNCSSQTGVREVQLCAHCSLQPINFVTLTRMTNNALCNWVNLMHFSSVQFVFCECCFKATTVRGANVLRRVYLACSLLLGRSTISVANCRRPVLNIRLTGAGIMVERRYDCDRSLTCIAVRQAFVVTWHAQQNNSEILFVKRQIRETTPWVKKNETPNSWP